MDSIFLSGIFIYFLFLFSLFYLYTWHIQPCVHTHAHKSLSICLQVHIWSFPQYLGTILQSLPSWKYTGEKEALFSVVPLKCSVEFLFIGLLSRSVSESVKNTHSLALCSWLLEQDTEHLCIFSIFSVLWFWRLAVHYNIFQSWHIW